MYLQNKLKKTGKGGAGMYSQETVRRRGSVRSYGAVSARERRRGAPSQERVRLLQLAVCFALFLVISLWKGIFPQKLNQVRDDLLTLITTDLNLQGALAELGDSLANNDSVFADLRDFCIEVFGAEAQDEPAEQTVITLPPSQGIRGGELRFFSQKAAGAAVPAHYDHVEEYGWKIISPEPEPIPVQDELEPPVQEETPVIPAVGTVIMVSDYSGEALPNNYTMDQLSLGELETMTPVLGHLNSEYGYRDHPINGRYQFHGGVDIGGQMGDPIGAFAAGTVEYVGKDDSYGLYLQIDHGNGVKSFYAHCSKIIVSKGQVVALGEKVAEIGSSGSATGPHLHLELKYNKMDLNPVYYVEFLEL